jgi:signal-transduction protein with cAMP-binding, CBS, and nucleotidyltransferase domain
LKLFESIFEKFETKILDKEAPNVEYCFYVLGSDGGDFQVKKFEFCNFETLKNGNLKL